MNTKVKFISNCLVQGLEHYKSHNVYSLYVWKLLIKKRRTRSGLEEEDLVGERDDPRPEVYTAIKP